MAKKEEIERSIIKRYRKDIWSKFIKAINDYELIQENDHIMVCISGGKDSFLLAKLLEEIKKHGKMHFSLSYVVMDPGYQKEHLKKIKANAKTLGVPIEIFKSDIFKVAEFLNKEKPCYMCSRMRRGHLYNKAKELGCNKIALGHHFDDVIETSLLSIFFGSEVKTMLPKLHSDHFKGIDLIRPMYLIKESSINSWASYNDLTFMNCACSFTSKAESDSKRLYIKNLINDLRKDNPKIDDSIFKALDNINMNCILGYHDGSEEHSFLERY